MTFSYTPSNSTCNFGGKNQSPFIMHELRKIQHTPEINKMHLFLQLIKYGSTPTFAEKTRGREMNSWFRGIQSELGALVAAADARVPC